jgi:hypothetical protein
LGRGRTGDGRPTLLLTPRSSLAASELNHGLHGWARMEDSEVGRFLRNGRGCRKTAAAGSERTPYPEAKWEHAPRDLRVRRECGGEIGPGSPR